ncbi:MAG: type II secretion system F family protein [Planctomycetota bacterium]
MPTFQYEASDATGASVRGTVEAASSDEAIQQIKMQGQYPTSVREKKTKASKASGEGRKKRSGGKKKAGGGGAITLPFAKVNSKQLTAFTRQLSTLQDAGLPLLRSLQILEDQQKPGLLKGVLVNVTEDVEGGSSLSDSMAKNPKAFDKLYCKMVAAGEVGGVLDVILQRLAEFMEKAERLKRQIIGSMIYPIAVITIAILIVTAIMVFIIPKFEEIFAEFGVDLPGITRLLIRTSSWVAGTFPGAPFAGYGAAQVIGGLILVPILWKVMRMTKPGRAVTDFGMLWTPVIGKIVRKSTIARFTRTLGTLIAAGVPILEAITITKDTCGNFVFERALGKVHDSVREGESFAEPLRQSKTCDPIVVNMIDVGEETGDIDSMLLKIADNYDEEVDVAVASLVSLIEPLMVVVLGGIVGTIVVAMFMPLVSMIEALQSG